MSLDAIVAKGTKPPREVRVTDCKNCVTANGAAFGAAISPGAKDK